MQLYFYYILYNLIFLMITLKKIPRTVTNLKDRVAMKIIEEVN